MIQDRTIIKAASRIFNRAERQNDLDKMMATFVDFGVLPQLENRNHQIIIGRRGTGKTHVFKVLCAELSKDQKSTVTYIDARCLGSTSQFTDQAIPIRLRCLSLFRDILIQIRGDLSQQIIERPSTNANQAWDALDELAHIITEPTKILRENSISTTFSNQDRERASNDIKIDTKMSGSLAFDGSIENKSKQEITTSYDIENQDKVFFPDLHSSLSRVLKLADVHLYVLIDEWSSLPLDIQPYLAEFLKRGLLPNPNATLKIASLEYRSQFFIPDLRSILGFELGPEISIVLNLDDYFVFDKNPNQITTRYADILLNHLKIELPDEYLLSEHGINSGIELTSKLFTEHKTFVELARAAEGVVRDLMEIFSLSFFDAQRRGRGTIDRKAIIDVSRKYYEQNKLAQLDDSMQSVLRRIVHEVIGPKKARSFLIPSNLEKHLMIQKLFDARVIHCIQRGYADKDNPGVRYNIYGLDYGTYVDLILTSKQQQQLPLLDIFSDSTDVIVPFDDKRSIRSIILTEETLSQWNYERRIVS